MPSDYSDDDLSPYFYRQSWQEDGAVKVQTNRSIQWWGRRHRMTTVINTAVCFIWYVFLDT